jgi:TRAP-type C4-dicarboxylate transport system permease small subunit
MGVLFIGAPALLLIPGWREGHAQAGWTGALGLPLWTLSGSLMVASTLGAALIVRHHRRR